MFQKSVLNNGVRIVTATLPHIYSVNLAVFLGAGSRYESDADGGAFHFIEHLCFKGTQRRPTAREVSEAIERVGGVMNASTQRELTTYWVKVARPHYELAQDLLLEMLLHSLFDPTEMEKERRVVLEELSSTKDHPDSRLEQLIDEVLWPNQPLGRDVGGTEESVGALTRQRLLELMEHQYIPSNSVVSVVSSMAHGEIVEMLAPHLGTWPTSAPMSMFPTVNGQTEPRLRMENRKTDQAHIALAFHTLPSVHPDRHAVDLMSIVLGEGMSSRLFLELRERHGLAYEAHSYVTHYTDTGALITYAAVDPKNTAQALQVTLEELVKMKDPVPEPELEKAKELAKGRLMIRLEDTRSLGWWAGSYELMEGHVPTIEEVSKSIDAVTPEDVQRVAKQFLVDKGLNLAMVGPFRSQEKYRRLLKL